ncbi:mitochondrial inner membrane protein Mpv17 isoform 1-T2 [Salvelinus alpinus]
MAGLWRSYQALMTRHPWTVQIITAGTLVGVGDVISQQVLERRGLANHNVTRTAKMMSIGFFFVGPAIGGWYKVLDKLVTGGTKSAAMKKMLVDQVEAPFSVCQPIPALTVGLCTVFPGCLPGDLWNLEWTDCGGERCQAQEGLHRCLDLKLLSMACSPDCQLLFYPTAPPIGCGPDCSYRLEFLLVLESQ